MQHKILFLLKNGIGFGHFRRALVIAEDLRKLGHSVFFLTQAKSTDLFKNKGFPVFNIPFMHRLPSNLSEIFLKQLINLIVTEIDPDIVIEDTDPDPIYEQISSLKYRHSVLIMRRIEEDGLLSMLINKKFDRFDKIIFLQPKQDLFRDISNPKLRLWLEFEPKITFTGPVFYVPTKQEISDISKKYTSNNDIIVFNAGAGGEHFGEGFCKKLFSAAVSIATELKNCQIIIVKGSNYKDEIIVPSNIKNVKVIDFEPNLPALFAISRICVLRPGYNAVFESLSGNADLLLIPSISYLEKQEAWIKQLQETYSNVYYLPKEYTNISLLNALKGIIKKPRTKRKLDNHSLQIAKHIIKNNTYKSGTPVLMLTSETKLPDSSFIDEVPEYGNSTPSIVLYVNKNKKYDIRKASLEERAILGIQTYKINTQKELEVLLTRNMFTPIAIFSKKTLKIPKKYNRAQMNIKEFASIILKDIL